jgi:hypothetical protein
MKKVNRHTRWPALLATLAITLSLCAPAAAIDDGARAYWKGKDGTQVFSFQYLRFDVNTTDSQLFAPDQFIYPNAEVEASIFIATWAHHLTVLKRPSSFAINVVGGNVGVNINPNVPPQFLPPGITPGTGFSQSSSGFADPNMQFVINLLGTPQLKSNVDLLNYEPGFTLDTALMVALPVGEYDSDKMVNLGLNRWYGRFALPLKYHFGVFAPGRMSSFELIPSVWLFGENDDFVGQSLENDPLWQVEAHLTHDFTRSFFASLDLLYRSGFQSEINGLVVGEKLDIGNLGFTMNYQVSGNIAIRTGFSTNVFGDSDLDNSLIRIGFVYGWHAADENSKKLTQGHH